MNMSISFSPDLAKIMAEETKAAERAVTLGVTQAGERLKSGWRDQITGAGLGTKLARTIRSARWGAKQLLHTREGILLGLKMNDYFTNCGVEKSKLSWLQAPATTEN